MEVDHVATPTSKSQYEVLEPEEIITCCRFQEDSSNLLLATAHLDGSVKLYSK